MQRGKLFCGSSISRVVAHAKQQRIRSLTPLRLGRPRLRGIRDGVVAEALGERIPRLCAAGSQRQVLKKGRGTWAVKVPQGAIENSPARRAPWRSSAG